MYGPWIGATKVLITAPPQKVDDQQILQAKQQIDAAGIGCEPASAASLAGLIKLKNQGVIAPEQKVVCILTGHILKDPNIILNEENPNKPISVGTDLQEILPYLD